MWLSLKYVEQVLVESVGMEELRWACDLEEPYTSQPPTNMSTHYDAIITNGIQWNQPALKSFLVIV